MGVLRIIVQFDKLGQTWNAWYENFVESSYGRSTPEEALGRLVQLDRLPDFEPCNIELVAEESTDTQFVYSMTPARVVCPECGGTGQYTGLNTVETCSMCNATGVLVAESKL